MEEKLTKAKLYRKIYKPFLEMGYLEFACKMRNGIFVKYLGDGWYLSVCPVIFSLYYDLFTADMWLNKHTWMNSEPFKCFSRPEDKVYSNEFMGWQGLNQDSLDDFLAKFPIAESNLIEQTGRLSSYVESSKRATETINVNAGVYNEYVKLFGNPSEGFESFNLQKPIKTPDQWFVAAREYKEHNPSMWFAYEMAADMAFREWMAREYASRMKK